MSAVSASPRIPYIIKVGRVFEAWLDWGVVLALTYLSSAVGSSSPDRQVHEMPRRRSYVSYVLLSTCPAQLLETAPRHSVSNMLRKTIQVLLALASFLGTEAAQPSAPEPFSAPVRDLPWGQLNFLHTTDTHGWHAGHLQE